jgi:hypothetical protein
MVGPMLLGGTITTLTIVQRDFLRSLGWHPINAPTTDWPSGLALGPYGAAMTGTFIVSGGLLALFALGLHQAIDRAEDRTGPVLLVVAGGATMLLAFRTDPSIGSTGRTVVGLIHDVAFGILGVSLLGALFTLARRFRQDPYWRGHALYTVVTALIVAPAFWFKGLMFYVFLMNILLWFELTAWRLWCVGMVKNA